MDLVWIYTYCSGDDTDDDVSKHLDTMVEERGNFPDADNMRSNLLGVHSKMGSRVKDKLTNVLAPLLQIPAQKKTTTLHCCALVSLRCLDGKQFLKP